LPETVSTPSHIEASALPRAPPSPVTEQTLFQFRKLGMR
jgi:hypothetical protein